MTSNDMHSNLTIRSDRLSHAYIASGSMADTLAMAAVCSSPGERPCMACKHCEKALKHIHPDITVVDKLPDKRIIAVDQIRELKKDVIIVPNESEKKAYIVNDADTMNRNAQNAFLQILEEPPAHAVFILRTENAAELLPTVRSRCVDLKAPSSAGVSDEAALDTAREFISALYKGNDGLAAFMFRLEKLDKEQLGGFLAAARDLVAAMIKADAQDGGPTRQDGGPTREALARAEKVLIRAGGFLDLNIGAGHIAGLICATLMKVTTEN